MSRAPFPGSLLSKQPPGNKKVFLGGFYWVFEKFGKKGGFFIIVHLSALFYFYFYIFIFIFLFYLSIHLFYFNISFSYLDLFIFIFLLIYFILINSFVLEFTPSVTPDFCFVLSINI